MYADGFYGCMVLVRQPFRSPNLIVKNAFQKMTEVRSWTECLVKLVDSKENGSKKLAFYNAHELLTLAAENETTLDAIISTAATSAATLAATTGTVTEGAELDGNSELDIEKIKSIKRIEPFYEIELKASYKFTELSLQQFDSYTKIHTFKIQEIIYKETLQIRPDRIKALPERFMKHFTKAKVIRNILLNQIKSNQI